MDRIIRDRYWSPVHRGTLVANGTRYLASVVSVLVVVGATNQVSLARDATGPDSAPTQTLDTPPNLQLRWTDLKLGFESSFEERRVRTHRGHQWKTHQVNRDTRFSESMDIRFEGSLLDPEFLEWRGGVKIGFLQERFHEEFDGYDRTESDSGRLLEYDVSIDAFRSQPLSLSAYARKSRDRVPLRFLPSLIEERSEAGVSLLALTGSWTTEIGFSWSDLDRTGNVRDLDNEHLENSRLSIDSRGNLTDRQRLHFQYEHQREKSTYQGNFNDLRTDRDELRIDHEWKLGANGEHRLDTFLRLNNERGDLARDEKEFGPRLTLHHSDALQTIYRYDYYEYTQDAIGLSRHKVDFEALYRPSEVWRINGSVFALKEHLDNDIKTDEYGVLVGGSYREPTAWGELTADAEFSVYRTETRGHVDEGIVRGEAHVLNSVSFTALLKPDIERQTIVAYNATRTRIYLPGIDFRLVPLGRRTAVTRLLSGRIAEDEPVYFDYAYRVPIGSRVDTYRFDFDVEHAFMLGAADQRDMRSVDAKVLTPYYRYELRRQFADGDPGVNVYEDNSERHRIGLRYEAPNRARPWSITGEAEVFHDVNLPYDAYHLTSQTALLRTPRHSLDLSAQLSRYLYQASFDRRHVWWFNVDLTDSVQLSRYWSAKMGAAYRYEDDSIDGCTNAVDLSSTFRFSRGYLDMELSFEYDLLAIVENREQGYGVWFNFVRDLSHVLPRKGYSR